MVVVCDTCALIMLLRIAPGMFEDERYGCMTIHSVWEEFARNARIGREYPWRKELRSRVRSVPQGELETGAFLKRLDIVWRTEQQKKNERTGRPFSLSWTDKRVAATCLTRHLELCTAEHNLEDFMRQEFESQNVSPLEIVNNWLEEGLIEWTQQRQDVIEEWVERPERPQPKKQICRFEKLTGRQYPA